MGAGHGPPYGKVPFVGQDDIEITFFYQGRPKKSSIQEFNGRKGVRFRVTRDYLDNATNSANDLILGSYHYLMQVDADGLKDAAKAMRETEGRFRKAIASGEQTSIEQGSLMMQAAKALSQE